MERELDKNPKTRPSWHIDAKWVFALILIPVLAITLIIFNLYKITEKENAIEVSGNLLSALISPGDSETDVAAIREKINQSPDKSLRPFPGTDIKITSEDLNKYSVKELKQKLFFDLAGTIYDLKGSDGNEIAQSEVVSKLGAAALFTKYGHKVIGNYLLVSSIISLLILSFVIFFSYGYGRFLSPGLIFLLVGLPSTALWFFLQMAAKNQPTLTSIAEDADMKERLSGVFASVLPSVSPIFIRNYAFFSAIGLILIVMSIIGKLIQKRKLRENIVN